MNGLEIVRVSPDPGSGPDSSPLAELQRQFVRAVLYRDSAGLTAHILASASGSGPGLERRVAIYRTNARENFALALEAAFPLLLRCVGQEEFRQLAWAYQRACPSPAGNLFHVGRLLPSFLADHLRGNSDEYLIDVARLEWLVQESLVAADGDEALDRVALAAVPTERQADIRFHLHPSVRLLRTDHSVFPLWEALQSGQPAPPASRVAECLLVMRHADGIQLHRLREPDLTWLESLQAGATLGEAAATLPAGEQAALGALLVRWVAAGVVTAFH